MVIAPDIQQRKVRIYTSVHAQSFSCTGSCGYHWEESTVSKSPLHVVLGIGMAAEIREC